MSNQLRSRRPVFDATLAVVPSDPLAAYEAKGRGGLLRAYYNPLRAFARVFCLSPFEPEERYAYGMQIIPTTQAELPSRLVELRVDVLRAYGGYWPCTYACAQPEIRIPRIVSVHDTNISLLHEEVRLADVVFTVSRAVQSLVVERGVDVRRTRMLPNRVDLEVFRPATGPAPELLQRLKDDHHRIVLHVGRKSYQKNIDTVIRAMARLPESYHVLFVGPGDDAEYRSLASTEGVARRCHFMDAVVNEALPAYYSLASCVCMPSRWEGFGIVFIEALACGAMVVASDVAPLNQYMRHEQDALLVAQFEDPEAMADAIRRACENEALRARVRSLAPAAALPFDQKTIDALEVGLYGEILGQSGD